MILINYFKSKYNKEYKYSSFDTKFNILKDLYKQKYDLASLKLYALQEDFDKDIHLYTEFKENSS